MKNKFRDHSTKISVTKNLVRSGNAKKVENVEKAWERLEKLNRTEFIIFFNSYRIPGHMWHNVSGIVHVQLHEMCSRIVSVQEWFRFRKLDQRWFQIG